MLMNQGNRVVGSGSKSSLSLLTIQVDLLDLLKFFDCQLDYLAMMLYFSFSQCYSISKAILSQAYSSPTCMSNSQLLREQSIVDAKGQNELDRPLAYIARKRRNILRSWLLLWNNPFLHAPSDYRLGLSRLPNVYSSARSIGPIRCAVENDGKHDDLCVGSMGIRPMDQQRTS